MVVEMRLFDTTFIIDLLNGDPGASALANMIDKEHSPVAISVREYLSGIYLRYFESKETLKAKLEAAERGLAAFPIIPLTREIAMESAQIQASLSKRGKMTGINDIYIAASAIVQKAVLVSRNSDHFNQIPGLSLETY